MYDERFYAELPDILRVFRSSLSMSRRHVAASVGISEMALSYIESGARKAKIETIDKIAYYYHLELSDIDNFAKKLDGRTVFEFLRDIAKNDQDDSIRQTTE